MAMSTSDGHDNEAPQRRCEQSAFERCLTLTRQQIFHIRCLSWYHVIYTLLWVEKSVWRGKQSPHKSNPWTIEADEIACIKPSKRLASVRNFTENTPQQEIIRSNEWTRNMFELTNILWQTLWGFFLFYFYCISSSVWFQMLDWQECKLASITSLQNR